MSDDTGLAGIDDPAEDPAAGRRAHALLNRLRDAPQDREDAWEFIAFAMANARRSKAQLFQDLWALWMSGGKRGGFFVEFGAGDGVKLSNTWLLEKEMGWSGILAEPHPAFAETLRQERGCAISSKCVYSVSGERVEFMAARKWEYSRIAGLEPGDAHEQRRSQHELVSVETISLGDLLTEHGAPERIDYMSVDTEGSEYEILGGFDFGRWDVAAITVEHNKTPARRKLYDLLTAKGYRRLWTGLSLFDDWYVKP